MDFGLIFELETLKARSPRRDYTLYWESMEQVERAEAAGFTHVWAVEHHFREGFSHNSAPEIWLTAAAGRTETIRLGHGVVQTLPPFNHPVRVAERLAAIDIFSNGRLEFGSGRAVNLYELAGWGIEANTRDMWLESVQLISKIWTSGYEPVDFEGEFVTFKDRVVLPRPFQDPHPPFWVAATSPDSYEIAGNAGMGVLGFGMAVDAEAMGRRISRYRDALATCTPVGAIKNDNVAVFMMAYCAETAAEAKRIAKDAFNWYLTETLTAFLGWAGSGAMPAGYEWYINAATHGADVAFERNFDYLLDGGMILCGTPDELVEQIKRYEAVGATQMLLGTAIGDIEHEDVLRSIDLMGREVIPHFRRNTERAAVMTA